MKTFKLDAFFNDPDSYARFCIANSQAHDFVEMKDNQFNTRSKEMIYKNALKGLLIEEINKFILEVTKVTYIETLALSLGLRVLPL